MAVADDELPASWQEDEVFEEQEEQPPKRPGYFHDDEVDEMAPEPPWELDQGPQERPRYSYSEITKPKPVDLKDRHGKALPPDFNPLRQFVNGLSRFGDVRPQHVVAGTFMNIDEFGKDLETFQVSLAVAIDRPWRLTWEKFAQPLEQLVDNFNRVWSAVNLLRDVNDTSDELHKAYQDLVPVVMELAMILAQSEEVYEVMRLLTHDPNLNEAQRRILQRHMLDAWHSGTGLQDVDVARRFQRNKQELQYLASLFAANVALDEEQEVLLAKYPEELAGLPPAVRRAAEEEASVAGHPTSPDYGPWLLRLNPSMVEAVLEKSECQHLRRDVYLAASQRGWRDSVSTGISEPVKGDNSWIVPRMIELRQYWAKAVGYESFAHMVFSGRMASIKQVGAFLWSLQNASLLAAEAELKELRAFALERGKAGEDLMPWDVAYWRAQLRRERLGLREEELEPYLALPRVLEGLFKLVERLFGIQIVTADGEVPTWDPSVRFLRVVDSATSVPIGGFYLDLYAAPRKRRPGFWADTSLSYSALLGTEGSPRRPVVHIIGDAPQPERPGSPTFLAFPQVLALFRAMGRAMQELLTDQQEGLVAGTKGMELDAVTFPQHFLELWAYDPPTIRSYARHFRTGEPMPENMVTALMASQKFHSGLSLLHEVRLARMDLELHLRYHPEGNESVAEIVDRIDRQESLDLPDVGEQPLCNFLGPFSTGYAAGYYTDLWAEVLAAEAFEAFQEEDGSAADDAKVAELGLLFREKVLRPGGGRAPLAAFRDFRGRIPRVAALLRRRGLSRGGAVAT